MRNFLIQAIRGLFRLTKTHSSLGHRASHILVEALTGDFNGEKADITRVALSGLDVYAHNMETVERLTPHVRDRRAKYRQSLEVLRHAKEVSGGRLVTKTSLMLGVGEQEEELLQTLKGRSLSRPDFRRALP